ncbi:unnamed protein product [Moneuplotes crassus]|uniref:Uncharacterized protein n=1 Tax=Euplotes crassus TaxID=5936 RepID=A0AAD1XRC2_EUPCR|nr:unnamed protein product [Moneuplotes crassus]
MKLVLLAILLAFSLANQMTREDGKFHFETDSNPESPIGFTVKGSLNPDDESESNVGTFFRLAEQLIPLAQSSLSDENKSNSLQFYRRWCFIGGGLGDAITVCAYANAELWIGWEVDHDGGLGLYNVTYTPFSYLRGGVNVSAASYPAEVSYGGYLSAYDIRVPINLLLSDTQICWSGDFHLFATSAFTAINTNLLQCQRSIPDWTPWDCDRVHGVEFQHLYFPILDSIFIDLLPFDCLTF